MEFTFPDVAEGITEGKLIGWKVKEGDMVKADQPLCEVETDKSTLELPSPVAGKVLKLHAKSGETIIVGKVLVTFDAGDEPTQKKASEEKKGVKKQEIKQPTQDSSNIKILPKDRALANQLGIDLSTITPTGPGGRITEDDIRKTKPTSQPTTLTPPHPQDIEEHHAAKHELVTHQQRRAPPSVRKLARELGVDIQRISTSDGRVTRDDIAAAAGEGYQKPAPEQEGKREKMEGIRGIIKRKMEESWRKIPHAAITFEVDITQLEEERKRNKESLKEKGIKLTILAYVVKVVAAALAQFPQCNALLEESSQEIIRKKDINIGIAVDTEKGLMVPNIKMCDKKSVIEIAKEIQILSEKARQSKLLPTDVTNGTFSISNIGSLGAISGSFIINYPEVAVLGVGRGRDVLVMEGEKVKTRKVMNLTLTFDHRIMDGGDAGRILAFMAEHLSNPSLMLIDVI